jgi:hypothetical protein
MSQPRKAWQDAKGKVKEKGWEAKIKFGDKFGPHLDELSNILMAIHPQLVTLKTKAAKLGPTGNLIGQTAKAYDQAIKGSTLTKEDKAVLEAGLVEAQKLAKYGITNIINLLHDLEKEADAAYRNL